MTYNKLLTINIPTYNRSKYLKRCIEHLYIQKDFFFDNVEINVLDNNSTDDTEKIVRSYYKNGFEINYIKNIVNIGPDRNISNAYLTAKSKYVLVLGDDDILLNGSIKYIINLLTDKDYGIVYLNFYQFKGDSANVPWQINRRSYIYKGEKIFRYALSNASFISANILNTKFILEKDCTDTTGTGLTHLPLILKAASRSDENVFVNKYWLGQQIENSGGYNYFDIFGVNFPMIVNKYLQNYPKGLDWIMFHLILKVFPHPLILARKKGIKDSKSIFKKIEPYFKSYKLFWISAYPITCFVKPLSYISYIAVKIFNKLFFVLTGVHSGKVLKIDSTSII